MRPRIKSYLVLNDGGMCTICGNKTIGAFLAPFQEGEAPAIFDVSPDIDRHELQRRRARKKAERLILRTIATAEELTGGTMLDDHPDTQRLLAALKIKGIKSFQIIGIRAGSRLAPKAFPIRK